MAALERWLPTGGGGGSWSTARSQAGGIKRVAIRPLSVLLLAVNAARAPASSLPLEQPTGASGELLSARRPLYRVRTCTRIPHHRLERCSLRRHGGGHTWPRVSDVRTSSTRVPVSRVEANYTSR